jgi:hypothetical protein
MGESGESARGIAERERERGRGGGGVVIYLLPHLAPKQI